MICDIFLKTFLKQYMLLSSLKNSNNVNNHLTKLSKYPTYTES
jgi:hypothetical protein